jgi:sugar lactone lactonase YvrE
VLADFAAFEAAHNPDKGVGPGPRLGNPSIDSDPYAFVSYRGGFAVADAGANDLLWVSPKGKVSVLAVFPTQTVKLTKAVATSVGLPPTLGSIAVQSVPDSVAVGPDGALYVGELTGRPFPRGRARVWRVVPGKKPSLYAAGFTDISDLTFQGRDLLVLEIAAEGLTDPKLAGALVRVTPDGRRRVIADGLVAPTGVAVGHGRIYISDCGVCPSHGPGPHGRLVSIQS